MLKDNVQNNIYESLGQLIKAAREKAGIKQELLAEFLDLSRVSISNIETGKQKIQIHTLLEVAKYLQLDVADLLHPLNSLIADTVTTKEEKRINTGTRPPVGGEVSDTNDAAKVKEFVNFLKSKNG